MQDIATSNWFTGWSLENYFEKIVEVFVCAKRCIRKICWWWKYQFWEAAYPTLSFLRKYFWWSRRFSLWIKFFSRIVPDTKNFGGFLNLSAESFLFKMISSILVIWMQITNLASWRIDEDYPELYECLECLSWYIFFLLPST